MLLFKCIAHYAVVPDDFGAGIAIPIIKHKMRNPNDINNYKGITLIPVVSKLFELLILEICKTNLKTEDLLFKFKKHVECTNAIFVIIETINYCLNNGSNIFGAALDLKKAFDRVNHFNFFSSLIRHMFQCGLLKH